MNDWPRGTPEWWDARYRNGDAPWDTGIVPPEVVALVNSGEPQPGWALDLGCGSGVTSYYLAAHGFLVAGIDLAVSALACAARTAAEAGLPALFCQGDATDLGFLRLRATLAVDVGCFHAIAPDRRVSYIASLADHLLPGGHYLLYAFSPTTHEDGRSTGVGPAELAQFTPQFHLVRAQHGHDRERPSAWYLWRRTASR